MKSASRWWLFVLVNLFAVLAAGATKIFFGNRIASAEPPKSGPEPQPALQLQLQLQTHPEQDPNFFLTERKSPDRAEEEEAEDKGANEEGKQDEEEADDDLTSDSLGKLVKEIYEKYRNAEDVEGLEDSDDFFDDEDHSRFQRHFWPKLLRRNRKPFGFGKLRSCTKCCDDENSTEPPLAPSLPPLSPLLPKLRPPLGPFANTLIGPRSLAADAALPWPLHSGWAPPTPWHNGAGGLCPFWPPAGFGGGCWPHPHAWKGPILDPCPIAEPILAPAPVAGPALTPAPPSRTSVVVVPDVGKNQKPKILYQPLIYISSNWESVGQDSDGSSEEQSGSKEAARPENVLPEQAPVLPTTPSLEPPAPRSATTLLQPLAQQDSVYRSAPLYGDPGAGFYLDPLPLASWPFSRPEPQSALLGAAPAMVSGLTPAGLPAWPPAEAWPCPSCAGPLVDFSVQGHPAVAAGSANNNDARFISSQMIGF